MIVAMAATWPFLDVSIATGAMGVIFPMLALPGLCLAFVLWMGVIEDSIPSGVARAVREPDPAPILAVPVRRTATAAAPARSARDEARP